MAELSVAELERCWQERCRSGKFSPAILGVGTIRVMGRSGDTPVQFPRIASLDALGSLEPDEVYAVRAAQQIINQARAQSRSVFAVDAPTGEDALEPVPVREFDPSVASMVIVARVVGG